MSIEESWTVQNIIIWTTRHFHSKQIDSSRLDAEVLLASVLRCRRIDLYLRFDQPLKPDELLCFKDLVKRRAKREPVAYILGEKEFYGRTFKVGDGVLVPRPETEHLIDEVLRWAQPSQREFLEILEVGAGSGCIAVTLAKELPSAKVRTLDSSELAANFAQENSLRWQTADRIAVEVQDFEKYDLRESLFDIVVSNPPYVAREVEKYLPSDVIGFEPHQALFGGQAGHETMAKWIPKMLCALKPGGFFACEIGFDQKDRVHEILKATELCEDVRFINDYGGNSRVATAIKI